MGELYEGGMKNRRAVLGDDYVDRSLARATPLSQPLQELITEYCWGRVWERDTLPRQTRSLLTVAMLMAGGHLEELATHVRGAIRNGCTAEEVAEVVIHGSIYCGVPASLSAMRVVQKVLEAEGVAPSPVG